MRERTGFILACLLFVSPFVVCMVCVIVGCLLFQAGHDTSGGVVIVAGLLVGVVVSIAAGLELM